MIEEELLIGGDPASPVAHEAPAGAGQTGQSCKSKAKSLTISPVSPGLAVAGQTGAGQQEEKREPGNVLLLLSW